MTELKKKTRLEFKGFEFQVKDVAVDEQNDICYVLKPLSHHIQEQLPEHAKKKPLILTQKTLDKLKREGYLNIVSEPMGGNHED